MTSIERTAYPRFSPHQVLGDAELIKFYTLTIEELAYIKKNIRGDQLRLGFGVQLKVFQQFYYFPALRHIPERIIKHVKQCLGISDNALNLHYSHAHTLHRHRQHILNYLTIRPWCKSKQRLPKEPVHPARRFALQEAYQAAQTLNHPADIINVVIEKLIQQKFQLPTFYRLNRLAKHARALVNQRLFKHIYQQMDMSFIQVLDELLLTQPGYQRTAYQDLKQLPKRPTLTHIKEALVHHHWLNSFGNLGDFLKQLPKIKLQQFAQACHYAHDIFRPSCPLKIFA